jgi:ABC-type antimicrobial peptide transport system permease subunit
VNESFVRRFFSDENPLGKKVSFGSRFEPPGVEIVGVVKDAKYSNPRQAPRAMIYAALSQREPREYVSSVEIRTMGDPLLAVAKVRQAIGDAARKLPIQGILTLRGQVDNYLREERLLAQSSSLFGLLGLLLASVGLYGVMSYLVALRTREIGVRMALGAQTGEVLGLIFRQGLRLTLTGVGIGIVAALALTRFLSSKLYGVTPTDPLIFFFASSVLVGVALLACYLPARRAARINPMVALRYE